MTDRLENFETELEELEVPDKKFRFANQKALLTYKTHIHKGNMMIFLMKTCDKFKKAYIAHETGDETCNYLHTHVVVDFGKALDKKDARFLDFEGIHPHIRKIKTLPQWRKACSYLTKEDKDVKLDDEDKHTLAGMIWKANTVQEALDGCTKLSDAMPIIAIYNLKPIEKPEPKIQENKFHAWQKDLWKILQDKPNDRKVIWVYEWIGNIGKTEFAKWVCLTYPEKAIMMNNIGKISDFIMNLQAEQKTGWRGDTVFINLSRSYADRTSVYEALEIIKDGFATGTKYAGGSSWFPTMHVVLFSNFIPHIEKLSIDRWDIHTIEVKDGALISVTLNEIKQKLTTHQHDGAPLESLRPKYNFSEISGEEPKNINYKS